MDFRILADYDAESGLGDVLRSSSGVNVREYFADKFYDDSGIKLGVVLMCRHPSLKFKQRIRFSKNENCLYMDIMLDFNQMKSANSADRKRIVAEKLVTEVSQIIAKYKFKDFDLKRFSTDLRDWFEQNGWLPPIE